MYGDIGLLSRNYRNFCYRRLSSSRIGYRSFYDVDRYEKILPLTWKSGRVEHNGGVIENPRYGNSQIVELKWIGVELHATRSSSYHSGWKKFKCQKKVKGLYRFPNSYDFHIE